MLTYILRKILLFFVFLFILSLIVFVIAHLIPGDPLISFYGNAVESLNTYDRQLIISHLGLDKPIYLQYYLWLKNLCHGSFGYSLKYKQPAIDIFLDYFINSFSLNILAFFLTFTLALLIALLMNYFQNSLFNRIISRFGTFFYYLPSFWLGLIFTLIFSINLHLLPSGNAYEANMQYDVFNRLSHIILPLSVIILNHFWYYTYILKDKLSQELLKEYSLFAKSKGLSSFNILVKHCLKNTLSTFIQLVSVSAPHLIGGSYIVEIIFNYPGLGLLSIESAKYHDYNLLMIIVLFTGSIIILFSILAQSINEFIDPRYSFRRQYFEKNIL